MVLQLETVIGSPKVIRILIVPNKRSLMDALSYLLTGDVIYRISANVAGIDVILADTSECTEEVCSHIVGELARWVAYVN